MARAPSRSAGIATGSGTTGCACASAPAARACGPSPCRRARSSTWRAGSTSCADLDRLAERLLDAATERRLDVAVAATDGERRALLRLRARHVAERGWGALAGDLERDSHDAGALHIGAWTAAGDLAGGMRLVLPAPGRRLPVEEAFGLAVEPRGAAAEAGRLVIAPEHRGDPAHVIWGALFGLAWRELRARGLTILAGSASPAMVERLTALGLPFETLGPAREHWGELRHPVRLDPAHSDPRWYALAARSRRG